MHAQIAQIVSLTCCANARARGFKTESFFPSNSTCRFCDQVLFEVSDRRADEGAFKPAECGLSADEWFEWLVSNGFTSFRTVLQDSRVPRSVVDGFSTQFGVSCGTWHIGAVKSGWTSYWGSRWHVWNSKAPDKRIWRVLYKIVRETTTIEPDRMDLTIACEELDALFERSLHFARLVGQGFPERFEKARVCLASKDPLGEIDLRDIAPDGLLSLDASRILAACCAAWVFGGMGSWNDITFDGEDEVRFIEFTRRLMFAMSRSVCAAANSSGRDQK